MFRKLLKYEWRDTCLPCLVICGMFIVLTAIGSITVLSGLYENVLRDDKTGLAGVMIASYFMAYGFSCFVMIVVIPFFFFYRYYKNLYTDQGYLMHTLPVKKTDLLWSKLLVSAIWQIIAAVVLVGCLCVFAVCATTTLEALMKFSWAVFFKEFRETFLDIWGEEDVIKLIPIWICMFISAVILPFTKMLFYYIAVGIGQMFKKHKLLMAVLAIYGMNFLLNTVSRIFMLPVYMVILRNDANTTVVMYVIAVLGTILLIGATVGEFFLNRYFLEKKVNLE